MPYEGFYKKMAEIAQGIVSSRVATNDMDLLEWCRTVRPVVEGKVRSFDLFPMWEEIYKNPAHNLMIMGGRQIAKSTYIADELTFLVTTTPGATVFYVTDSDKHLSEFSNQKLRRGCIDVNPLIKRMVAGGKNGNVTEIKWNNGAVFYLGTDEGKYGQVESTSPIEVVLDESQYQELQYLPILYEAMSASRGKMKIVGVGGEAGGPLEAEWLLTDQREWVYDDPEWYWKLKFNNETPARIINPSEELRKILRGQWVAKKPENYMYPGYHLPQDIFPHIPKTIEDCQRRFRLPARFSLEYKEKTYPKSIYLTHVKGTFYHAMRRPITRQMVEACMMPYGQYYLLSASEVRELKRIFGNEIRILAGIDFGSGPANSSTVVAIVIKWKKSGRYQLAWIEKRPAENLDDQAEYLTQLLTDYQIDIGVGDLGHGAIQVKHIQDGHVNRLSRLPYPGLGSTRFMGCRSIGDETKPQQEYKDTIDEHGEEVGRLQIDKTTSIQKFIDFLEWYVPHPKYPTEKKWRVPKLMIPYGNTTHVDFLINEWTQLTRKDIKEMEDVDVEDPRQRPRKEFNHPKDSLMAMIYVMTADEQEEGGFEVTGIGHVGRPRGF